MIKGEKFAIVLKSHIIEDGFATFRLTKKEVFYEIEKNGFRAINWRDQMITEGENTLGYFANEPGLRLRKEPNSESEIIGSVRGDLFEIKLTKTISGQWCKVKVKKYKEHPCNTDLEEAENIESKTEGWLKIIDDNGEPNLWSYTRGC